MQPDRDGERDRALKNRSKSRERGSRRLPPVSKSVTTFAPFTARNKSFGTITARNRSTDVHPLSFARYDSVNTTPEVHYHIVIDARHWRPLMQVLLNWIGENDYVALRNRDNVTGNKIAESFSGIRASPIFDEELIELPTSAFSRCRQWESVSNVTRVFWISRERDMMRSWSVDRRRKE